MKDLDTMNLLELKGILFDLDNQIRQIQAYAQKEVLPMIKKWEDELKLENETKLKGGK